MNTKDSNDKKYYEKSQNVIVKMNDDQYNKMQKNVKERTISKVFDRHFVGEDEQADNKAILLEPGHWKEFDPFLLLAEDWFSTRGFEWHPHRGIETITIVLDGELEHRDSRGGYGILRQGDVQWMTAGSGLLHREMAHKKQPVHTLQLWVNLPADKKMVKPRYQDLKREQVPVRKGCGWEARVFLGQSGGIKGPAANNVPVTMLDVYLSNDESSFSQEIPAGEEGFVLVLSGEGRFGMDETTIKAGQIGYLSQTSINDGPTNLTAKSGKKPLRFILWTGRPLHQPVVAHGPFVMNTKEQIIEAFEDYRAGAFGQIPTSSL
ncbi:MAG: pirin family protein [Thermoproteota archaeon]|nr:pirin family protein [Thermoproteota archaeon]